VYAAPSRLQLNEAGSFALNENTAASSAGNSAERLVSGGLLSFDLAAADAAVDAEWEAARRRSDGGVAAAVLGWVLPALCVGLSDVDGVALQLGVT
jgi:hypothetical protein